MTETAKERIYREAFEEIKKVCDTQDHVDNDLLRFFITKKMMEIENLPSTTDKLSVEKLEPIGYYNEAHGFLHDEFDKDCYCQGGCSMEAVYTESQVKKLTDEKTVEKLQEQLNTAKKALTESKELLLDMNRECDGLSEPEETLYNIISQALAAIGDEK